MSLRLTFYSRRKFNRGRLDTRHNDIYLDDTKHNANLTIYNETQHNVIQHNDT